MRHSVAEADREFARSFEAGQVTPEAFDHAAHVRLAYIYLCEGAPEAAAARMKDAILAFLTHLAVSPSKYHETITRAWIMAVAHFMNQSAPCESAAAFMALNPQLLDSRIMLTHYSAQLLFSAEARKSFVQPDIDPIPEH